MWRVDSAFGGRRIERERVSTSLRVYDSLFLFFFGYSVGSFCFLYVLSFFLCRQSCFSPLWVAFAILIGGLLLDVLISVSLGVSALPVNIIIGTIPLTSPNFLKKNNREQKEFILPFTFLACERIWRPEFYWLILLRIHRKPTFCAISSLLHCSTNAIG